MNDFDRIFHVLKLKIPRANEQATLNRIERCRVLLQCWLMFVACEDLVVGGIKVVYDLKDRQFSFVLIYHNVIPVEIIHRHSMEHNVISTDKLQSNIIILHTAFL